MDPEKQPLLRAVNEDRAEVRYRGYRPLTAEEVQQSRQEVTWRRARFLIKFLFWGIMAMFLSIIACILIQAPYCKTVGPAIPPVHMTFAPLFSSGLNDGFNAQGDDLKDPVYMT